MSVPDFVEQPIFAIILPDEGQHRSHRQAEKSPLWAGSDPRLHFTLRTAMGTTKEISVFIDESGSFDREDISSRYYLVCMVFHDQTVDLTAHLAKFEEELRNLGLGESHCIHAGPLIRREQDYRNMSREERRFIFSKMLAFARKAEFSYKCFHVDKRFVSSTDAMHDALLQQILAFLIANAQTLNAYERLKIFYDNGQAQVSTILKEAFAPFASKTEFVPQVSPTRYRLFQLATQMKTP